jgi:hypothetical protein
MLRLRDISGCMIRCWILGVRTIGLYGLRRLLQQHQFVRVEAADFAAYIGGARVGDLDDYLGHFGV